MPDHYRTLVESLRQLGFLFSRVGDRKQEVWRNRLTEQEVMFDRHEVTGSPAEAARVLKQAKNAKPGERATADAPTPALVPDGPVLRQDTRAAPRSAATAQRKAMKAKRPGAAKGGAAKGGAGKAKAGPRKGAR